MRYKLKRNYSHRGKPSYTYRIRGYVSHYNIWRNGMKWRKRNGKWSLWHHTRKWKNYD